MSNITEISTQLIADVYKEYRPIICRYICRKLNGNAEEAEDLAQDTFCRLMDYRQMLRPETVKSFLFTIARNVVTDYLRRYYKRQEIDIYLMESLPQMSNDLESKIIANELGRMERWKVASMPQQRRNVYIKMRYEEMTADDIALDMNLSKRTVERHILLGRKEVRNFIKQCI